MSKDSRPEIKRIDVHYLTAELRMEVYDPSLYTNLDYKLFPFTVLSNNSGNFERRIYIFAWESLTNVKSNFILDRINEIYSLGREPSSEEEKTIRKDWERIEEFEFDKIKNRLQPVVDLWQRIIETGFQNGLKIR